MTNHHALKAISDLDLGPVKVKLMHQQSGEGWDQAQAEAVEAEYKRFLHLMRAYPDALLAPSREVDTFWHYHILDTMKYAADCAATFGYFLHHNPNVGLGEDASEQQRCAERMAQLYQSEFGTPYPAAGSYCTRAILPESAYCTRAIAPESAYCTRAIAPASAYCTRAIAAAAAYCTRVSASSSGAYCTRAPAALATAYCTRAIAQDAAYCTRAIATESRA